MHDNQKQKCQNHLESGVNATESRHSRASDKPPLVNPEEFLTGPLRFKVGVFPQELDIFGRLEKAPDAPLLRWLTTLENITGLFLWGSDWYVVRGSWYIPSANMPDRSKVLLHSHPSFGPDAQDVWLSVPDSHDFYNSSPTSKNLIVTPAGITECWPVEDPEGKRDLETEVKYAFSPRFVTRDSIPEYLKFLEEIHARYEIHPWDEGTKQEVLQFLNGIGSGYAIQVGELATEQKLMELLRPSDQPTAMPAHHYLRNVPRD